MLVCSRCGSTYTKAQEYCGLDGTPLGTLDPLPMVGRMVDRYQIVDVIGSGGMAMVYRALHTRLEKHFAFKALHGQMASDEMLAKRFHREAKVLSRLSHPNIVAVTDFGSTEHGVPYMVMELLEGDSLWIRARDSSPIPPSRVAEWTTQIAAGLDLAHRKGFVHRDLKPQNIMLVPNPDGEGELIKILDFGLVAIMEPDPAQHTQLTREGMFFGTPSYMSPEQITGGEVKATADLYSLGVLMYLLLTGEVPFRGDMRELAHQHVSAEPSRPMLEYGGLTPVVMQLLEKDPKRRFPSARALMKAVEETGLLSRPLEAAPLAVEPTRVDRVQNTQSSFEGGPADDEEDGPALTFSEHAVEAPPLESRPRRRAGAGWWWASAAVVLLTVVGLRVGWDRVLPAKPSVSAARSEGQLAEEAGAAPTPAARAAGGGARAEDVRPAPSPKEGRRTTPAGEAESGRQAERPAAAPAAEPESGEDGPDSKLLFAQLDEALTTEIAQRGVAWSAVEAKAQEAAYQWGAWYRDPSRADPKALRRVQGELMETVAALGAEVSKRDPSSPSETKARPSSGAPATTPPNETSSPTEAPRNEAEVLREEASETPVPPSTSQDERSDSQSETGEPNAGPEAHPGPPDSLDPRTEDALDRSLKKLSETSSTS